MNKKYLFGMLLSGALLAACTADDALDAAKVAQDGAMQAPVFTVSLENEGLDNRATLSGISAGSKIQFDGTDKLSLFHGIKPVSNAFPTGDINGWQNAIYAPKAGAGEGKLEFETHAMVQRGYAIMVFPADEGFTQMGTDGTTGEKSPVIKVKADQTRETRDNTPYMSEFILLKSPASNVPEAETAGYGKEYDLVLKRAAGTLYMNLNNEKIPTVAGADPLQVRAVEIRYANKTFPTQLSIERTTDPQEKPVSSGTYKSWAAISGLDIVNIVDDNKSEYLKTKDVEDNSVATFTILPWKPTNGWPTAGTLKVTTNYGIVTITTDGTGDKVFGSGMNKNLDEIFGSIAEALYHPLTNSNYFNGEWAGAAASTKVKVDMSKLTVDGLHIDNEADLITALKVYDAREKAENKKVTITLDGTKGNFTMSAATLNTLSEHMIEGAKEADKGLKVAACAIESEILNTIVVTGSNGAEVPSLIFVDAEAGVSKTVNVQLEGSWKYTGVEDNPSTRTVDERKVMKNVETIVNNGTLTMSGIITASDNAGEKSEVAFENDGTINVSGETYTKLNIDNYGTINIPATAKLLVDDSSVLTNMEAQDPSPTKAATAWDKGAEIVNEGWLGVVEKSSGETQAINNYGIIYSKGKARTFVTTNAREDVEDLGTAFASGDDGVAIGTIIIDSPLMKKDELVVVGDADNEEDPTYQGFILLEVTKTNPKFAEIGDVANYVLLSGSCEGVTFTKADKGVFANLPDNVKYIEVNSSKEVTFYGDEAYDLTGLFVRATSAGAAIPQATTIKVAEELYIAAKVALGGTIDLSENSIDDAWDGYHNGDGKSTIKNVVSTGNGKVITE